MGSDFSKGKSHRDAERYGQIFLQTDKATYFGGETVTGRIYLNLFLPYPGKQIFLKLKGKEAVHFVIQRQETQNNETRTFEELFQEKADVIKLTVPIYSWATLLPGQFVIPFSFMLPANLPSTFHQEGHRHLANISYRLEAILEPSFKHEPKLKYKQNFVVRTPVKNAAASQSSEIRTELTTCCCCSQGSNVLRVNFEKNYYAPGEIAQVIMQLDNGQSKIDNTRLCFALKQRLILNAAGRTHQSNYTKVERDLQGIRAGGASDSNLIAMNLPSFQGGDYYKVKGYNMVDYLIRLQNDNNILNSATKSKHITSEYYLEAFCPMSGCCASTPSISRPIEIYYPEIQLQQVPTPANWQPQIIETVTVSFGMPMPQMQVQMNVPQMQVQMEAPQMQVQMGGPQMQMQVNAPPVNVNDVNLGMQVQMNVPQMQVQMDAPQMQMQMGNPGMQVQMDFGGNQQMPPNQGGYGENYYKPYN